MQDCLIPPQWEHHKYTILAYPINQELWDARLISVQKEFINFCIELLKSNENLKILFQNDHDLINITAILNNNNIEYIKIPYDDIWIKDTGPIFTKNKNNIVYAHTFNFNGWGNKYLYKHDLNIGNNISKIFNLNISKNKYILEGGSIEADGRGTCLTTKQCLLNKNRNPQLKQIDIETNLKNELGLKNILWIDSGLYGDHTDGHIDTLARFIAPGQIICMYAKYKTDPNYYTLKNNITKLKKFKDITGKYFDIIEIESPGVIRNYKGKIMPASYINFYHANNSVIIPNFNNNINETTLDILSKYSKKRIVTLAAENILTGGGTFNCITLQIPSGDNID